MASQFDDSDFVDRDYQRGQTEYNGHSTHTTTNSGVITRPPSREELDSRVGEAQLKLAELKRAQEELERERSALEEARRRRLEFQTGREEMLQSLARGVALLEQAEFTARRDSEQMGKTLADLREALLQLQNTHEETWNQENWNVELSKALASIENARMEWNSARLKWSLLNGQTAAEESASASPRPAWQTLSFWQLSRVGLALTWPVALVALAGVVVLAILRLR